MRNPRIYHPSELTTASFAPLHDDAANHVARVLRLKEGDAITLFNGDGSDYIGKIASASRKNVMVEIVDSSKRDNESPLTIDLGQVISRGDRMDFTLQKSVELGVNSITPLFSERCGVKLNGERLDKKQEQWQKVVISACEQSGRACVPKVLPAMELQDWLAQDYDGLRLNLHPYADKRIKQLTPSNNQVQLLIGPEGGLSDQEIAKAAAFEFTDVLMGPRVLRTETAALSAIAMLQCQFGDL